MSRKQVLESGRQAVSFMEEIKDRPRDAVLVIGSSMARGVGSCLERQCRTMYSTRCYPGARIQDIEHKLRVIGDKPQSHVI